MNCNILDYIIIGGGIAGLYSNYLLSEKKNGILLEKESYFGGRVLETKFHDSVIKLGAGIITTDNKKMLKLVKQLKIPINSFNSKLTSLLPIKFNLVDAVKQIKKVYNENKDNVTKLTVEEFLIKYFGKEFANLFIANCEYHDFMYSDVSYFIKYYKIDDMIHNNEIMYGISWTLLVNKLLKDNCYNNSMVTKITKDDNNFIVFTENMKYVTKKVILAVTLKPLDKLLKNMIDFKYSDYIGSVPFIRIYSYHNKPYDKTKLGGFNIVDSVLYKIIQITNNILMISYADDKDAIKLKKLLQLNKNEQIKSIQELVDKLQKDNDYGITKVDDVLIHFWDEGVHYYKPFGKLTFNQVLKKLKNPMKGIKVIGEMVSKKQGYVEGAITSI